MARRVKTPTVLQFGVTECGAASLAMILGFHKKFLPLETLRISCGVSRDGTKATGILKAARHYGLESKGLKAEPSDLQNLKLPLIAFVDFCHFLVVEGIDETWVWLNDPARGRLRISRVEFDERFTGVVLTFERGKTFEKSNDLPSFASSLLDRMQGVKSAVSFVFIVNLALILPGLIIPLSSRVFVDFILVRNLSDWLLPLVIGLSLTAASRYFLQLLRDSQLTRTETAIALESAKQLLQRILKLPLEFFGSRSSGEIASRLGLSDKFAHLITGALAETALNLFSILFFIGLMAYFSVHIALIVFLCSCLHVIFFVKSTRSLSGELQKLAIDEGSLAGVELSGIRNIESFKASGAEDVFFRNWSGRHASILSLEQRVGQKLVWVFATGPFLSTVISGLVLIFGGLQIMRGEMSLGTLVALQSLAASVTSPLISLTNLGTLWQEARSFSERTDDIYRHPIARQFMISDEQQSKKSASADLKTSKQLSLQNVSFGYAPLEPPLVKNLNLDIEAGTQIAFVGQSGAGKSTVGRLIAGLIEPNDGVVNVDEQSIIFWNQQQESGRLAYVDQKTALFHGTVRDNLTMWKSGIDDSDVINAAKDAMIHETIADRPGGYGSNVDEGGSNFSGGQQQRLEIARALVSNPEILVLDEATSALDAITEFQIMKTIKDRAVTLIIIAHRLSAIKHCDKIYVFENGNIVEHGTHAQLMKQGGLYTRLIEN